MDKSINIILVEYLKAVKEKYADLEFAMLFGSFAKGRSNEESDIDLALIFGNLEDEKRFELQVELMILAASIDTRIEPHPISLNDYNSGNPFFVEIKRTGIQVAA